MRPILRTWTLLLITAIVLVIGLFWARAKSNEPKKNPLELSQADIEKGFGMKLETGSKSTGGLKVEAVKKGSPADKLGMKVGDRVVAVGDRSVWHVYQFHQYVTDLVMQYPAVMLLVEQNGEYRQVVFSGNVVIPLEEPDAHGH
jgi:predicted metalloprotease with PDZ domain